MKDQRSRTGKERVTQRRQNIMRYAREIFLSIVSMIVSIISIEIGLQRGACDVIGRGDEKRNRKNSRARGGAALCVCTLSRRAAQRARGAWFDTLRKCHHGRT